MKWMRERDLLIAQTMAFVQSVTGKTPEAEKTVTRRLPCSPSRHPKPPARPSPSRRSPSRHCVSAGGDATRRPGAKRSQYRAEASTEMPREISRPAPLARPDLREDFQSEIRARVASFRAHQERFNREREAYCSATMAKVHAALREGERRPRPDNSAPTAQAYFPAIFSSTGSRCVRNSCRVLAHRKMAEALHDGGLAAWNAVRDRRASPPACRNSRIRRTAETAGSAACRSARRGRGCRRRACRNRDRP